MKWFLLLLFISCQGAKPQNHEVLVTCSRGIDLTVIKNGLYKSECFDGVIYKMSVENNLIIMNENVYSSRDCLTFIEQEQETFTQYEFLQKYSAKDCQNYLLIDGIHFKGE